MDKKSDWSERGARLFCIITYSAICYAFMRYAMQPLLPLLAAVLISWIISSFARRLSVRTGVPHGVWAFLIVSALLCSVCFALFFALRALLGEVSALLSFLSRDGSILGDLSSYIEAVPVFEYMREELRGFISGALSSFSSMLSGVLSSVLRSTPRAIIGGFVFLMSVYYMSVDFDCVKRLGDRMLPSRAKEYLHKYKSGAFDMLGAYLWANLIIFVMTFALAMVGLLIICPEYSIIGALGVAVIDILPVFGAGAVLIPWGIFEILCGDAARGVGLFILYIIISIIRRIAEPKILGKSMGIPPLAALICMYVGYRFFGVVGMLSAPFLVAFAVNVIKE